MIFQKNLITGLNKVETAIERIKLLTAGKKVTVAFSGGKDSMAVKTLCDMAEIQYDLRYRVTSMDPPEVIYFIKSQGAKFEYPGTTFFKLLEYNKGTVPTAFARYCCRELKETAPNNGEVLILGIRWSESAKRSKRLMTEHCMRTGGSRLSPIIDWTEAEVWEFHEAFNVPHCSLYDKGYKRIGCIGCTLKNKRERERDKERYPWFFDKCGRILEEIAKKHGRSGTKKHFQEEFLLKRSENNGAIR